MENKNHNQNQEQISLDILQHIEDLSRQINEVVGGRTRSAFSKYPLTFALLVLVAVVCVSEGIKGVLEEVGWFDGHPWHLLVTGLCVLVITGTIYKKLDKE